MRGLKVEPGGAALICGSMAFDTIMTFPDRFKAHILPDKVHMLNVAFLVPELRREFGGCAGNIAFNLHLLGGRGLPMATVGKDFAPYAQWLTESGVAQTHLRVVGTEHTAQAFITTDLDNNQITSFHPGAMQHAHLNQVGEASDVSIGIVAPDGRQAMIEHAAQFAAAGIPFIFDPGQALPLFNGEELVRMIEQANYVTVNDYESSLLQDKTGLSTRQIAERVQAYLITRGADGSEVHTREGLLQIPAATAIRVVDPTGCGDAYRAGLIHGWMSGMDMATTGRIASLMGALKIEHLGPQNQHFDLDQFAEQFRQQFGYALR